MDKNISLLSKTNIQSRKLINLIPEFYELETIVENNDWHHKENVFDHSLSVLDNLEKVFRTSNKETRRLLNKKIDGSTRKNLLKIATLFHDIAKKETIIDNNGSTLCPSHEDRGSIKAKTILKRFKLSEKELKFVSNIVENHGLIHKILLPDNQNFQKEFVSFKKRFFHNIYPELILLAFADTVGSYLTKTHPTEFKFRISFYKKEIKNLLPKSKI